MKLFSESLVTTAKRQLDEIHATFNQPIEYSEQAVKVLSIALEKLKTECTHHRFETKTDEIDFFKNTKPQIASLLIYYNEIYNIESTKPAGSKKDQRKYYTTQLQKIKKFYKENAEFYKYSKLNNTYLDKKYFLRGKHDIKLALDSFYFQSDHRFSTSHDYKKAQVIAYEKLQTYLLQQIKDSKQSVVTQPTTSALTWTQSKVALVELIYALHSEGVCNNGHANLKEIAISFEKIFNIELGQFNRIYLEIRNRKSIEKTHFLDSLRSKLLQRIDEADEK